MPHPFGPHPRPVHDICNECQPPIPLRMEQVELTSYPLNYRHPLECPRLRLPPLPDHCRRPPIAPLPPEEDVYGGEEMRWAPGDASTPDDRQPDAQRPELDDQLMSPANQRRMHRVSPLSGQTTGYVARFDSSAGDDGMITRPSHIQPAPIEEANVITSAVTGRPGMHKPVLDIDMSVYLFPSSTPGHFHLIIDKEMDWNTYKLLLYMMMDAGLLEPGYVSASKERGYTAVRLPWVRKGQPNE